MQQARGAFPHGTVSPSYQYDVIDSQMHPRLSDGDGGGDGDPSWKSSPGSDTSQALQYSGSPPGAGGVPCSRGQQVVYGATCELDDVDERKRPSGGFFAGRMRGSDDNVNYDRKRSFMTSPARAPPTLTHTAKRLLQVSENGQSHYAWGPHAQEKAEMMPGDDFLGNLGCEQAAMANGQAAASGGVPRCSVRRRPDRMLGQRSFSIPGSGAQHALQRHASLQPRGPSMHHNLDEQFPEEPLPEDVYCDQPPVRGFHVASGVVGASSDQDSAGRARNASASHADDSSFRDGVPAGGSGTDGMPTETKQRSATRRRATGSNDASFLPEHLTDSQGTDGLKLLSEDMHEEFDALQQTLSLPVSLEELQEGALNEVADDLMKTIRKKGKGGRNPAGDARLDPSVDPKKASRIMANRLSAARSKLRQKLVSEGRRVKLDMLLGQKKKLTQEMEKLRRLCGDMEQSIRLEAGGTIMMKQEPGLDLKSSQPVGWVPAQHSPSPMAQPATAMPAAAAAVVAAAAAKAAAVAAGETSCQVASNELHAGTGRWGGPGGRSSSRQVAATAAAASLMPPSAAAVRRTLPPSAPPSQASPTLSAVHTAHSVPAPSSTHPHEVLLPSTCTWQGPCNIYPFACHPTDLACDPPASRHLPPGRSSFNSSSSRSRVASSMMPLPGSSRATICGRSVSLGVKQAATADMLLPSSCHPPSSQLPPSCFRASSTGRFRFLDLRANEPEV